MGTSSTTASLRKRLCRREEFVPMEEGVECPPPQQTNYGCGGRDIRQLPLLEDLQNQLSQLAATLL